MKNLRIGIDFGTSTTSVSLKVGDERAVVLPIGRDGVTRYIPSVVYFPPGAEDLSKRVIVGEQAEQSAGTGYVIHSIKRCLGCRGYHCEESRHNGNRWCKGDGKAHIPGVGKINPEEIAYFIIREALKRAVKVVWDRRRIDLRSRETLFLPTNLGCGAAFNFDQRNLLIKIVEELGFKRVRIANIVEEPILAGFAFSRYAEQPEGRILIYDFGGGSFDTAILDIDYVDSTQRVTVLATAGDNWLGGDDIDSLVLDHFIRESAKRLNVEAREVEDALRPLDIGPLRRLSKNAKETLTTENEFSDVLMSNSLGMLPLELTRSELENLLCDNVASNSNLIDRSLETVLHACKLVYAFEIAKKKDLLDAEKIVRYTLDQAEKMINRVVLVGGVTKMPIVRSRIAEIFSEDKIFSQTVVDPIDAVAIGAGYELDPKHYSIAYPPFEFILELQENQTSEPETIEVFLPFEYYRFHEEWAFNCVPVHKSQIIELPKTYEIANLIFRRVGEEEQNGYSLGRMREGCWQFFVELDGEVSVKYQGEARRKLGPYPLVHPVQNEIKRLRNARYDKKVQEAKDRASERWITIYTEN